MPRFFMLHDPQRFNDLLSPALAASWRRRSFGPCGALRAALDEELGRFADENRIKREDLFLLRIGGHTPFDRDLWRVLVGEVLLCAAADVPEIPTAAETLGRLLLGNVQIVQAHQGTRPLVFGWGWYRPDNAGYNDCEDVLRLSAYLHGLEPARWTTADLGPRREGESEEERQEELEFARATLPPLRAMYERARADGQIIICEAV
jgi:hypothetical protein